MPDGIVGPATAHALGVRGGAAGAVTPAGAPPTAGGATDIDAALRPGAAQIGAALGALAGKVGGAVIPHASRALYVEPKPETPAAVSSMHMSKEGRDWLSAHESQKGVSNHLYWPTGASGVTLGAGYDMKDRSAAAIKADMLQIGLSAAQAATASQGAGLKNNAALAFANAHKKDISLTSDQESALLALILPHYEKIVQGNITIDLLQTQFDALVSFAYNPGGKFSSVAKLIDAGKTSEAMADIKKRVYSGGDVLKALVRRRNDEVACYLYGKYETT